METVKHPIIFPKSLVPLRQAVEKAHQLCQSIRSSYTKQLEKDFKECVTLADYGVQVIINRLLRDISPGNSVIAEENSTDFREITSPEQQKTIVSLTNKVLGENMTLKEFVYWLDYGQDKGRTENAWVIDPIDGTQEFLNANRYVIGIGELENSQPTFSYLSSFSPERQTGIHFFTLEDHAYRYDPVDESILVLHVSDRPVLSARPYCNNMELTEVYSIDYIEADVYSTLNAYISIAMAEADVLISHGFANTSEKIWDHVAGIPLLRMAGGIISDVDGGNLDFSHGKILSKNKGVVLSNGKFHDKLISK